jgi:hypothetical protein
MCHHDLREFNDTKKTNSISTIMRESGRPGTLAGIMEWTLSQKTWMMEHHWKTGARV